MSKKKPAPPAPKPVQTYRQALAWVRGRFTVDELREQGHASPQAALLWWYANFLSDQMADYSRREWAEVVQGGMKPLTARGMAREMREELEDEPETDWRGELAGFFGETVQVATLVLDDEEDES